MEFKHVKLKLMGAESVSKHYPETRVPDCEGLWIIDTSHTSFIIYGRVHYV